VGGSMSHSSMVHCPSTSHIAHEGGCTTCTARTRATVLLCTTGPLRNIRMTLCGMNTCWWDISIHERRLSSHPMPGHRQPSQARQSLHSADQDTVSLTTLINVVAGSPRPCRDNEIRRIPARQSGKPTPTATISDIRISVVNDPSPTGNGTGLRLQGARPRILHHWDSVCRPSA
jgi:hypothetical protein